MVDARDRDAQESGDKLVSSNEEKPKPFSDEEEPIATPEADADDGFAEFSCGSCQAEYIIAMEKVKGKVFRVNCKQCGGDIIIKGDKETPSDAPAMRYSSIPQRQSLIDAPATLSEPGAGNSNNEKAPSLSAQAALSDGSLFSSDVDPLEGDEKEPADEERAVREASGDEQSGVGPSAPAEASSMATSQTSSVLFSRSGLENLAASSTKAEVKRSSPSYIDESSGLIDIRALASPIYVKNESDYDDDDDDIMTLGAAPTSFNPPVLTAQSKTTMNMWMKITIVGCVVVVLVAGGILWSTTASSPESEATSQQIIALQQKLEKLQKSQRQNIPVPVKISGQETEPSPESKDGEETTGKQETQKNTQTSAQAEKSEPGTSAEDKGSSPSPGKATDGQPKPLSEPGDKPESADEKAPPLEVDPNATGQEGSSDTIPDSPYASSDQETEPPVEVNPAQKANKEIDALLGQDKAVESPAASSQQSNQAPSSAIPSGAKPRLDRGDVQKGMNKVAARVKACAQGQIGRVTVKVVIGQTGRVASAVAVGPFAGTAVGTCAAKEVRKAKFPITQATLTVKYPFNLQ